MFNNPLKKYQQGGQVSQEQQQMLAVFVEWLPKRVKEFQGMQPEQIVEALNGMTKSPEGQKQVQAYMQQFQQELQEQQAGMFKDGGKLQDFICKHAKGGKAGCGCKEDGGKVEKHTNGKPVRNGNYEVSVNAPGDTTRTIFNKWNRQIMQTYPDGSVRYTTMSNNNGDPYQANSWTGKPSLIRRLWFGSKAATPEKVSAWNEEIASQPLDPRNQKKENGGIVKGQAGVEGIHPGYKHVAEYTSSNRISPAANINPIWGNLYEINGELVTVPTKAADGALRWHGIDSIVGEAGYNSNGEIIYSPEAMNNIRNFYEHTLPDSNRVQEPKQEVKKNYYGGLVEDRNSILGKKTKTVTTDITDINDFPVTSRTTETLPNGWMRKTSRTWESVGVPPVQGDTTIVNPGQTITIYSPYAKYPPYNLPHHVVGKEDQWKAKNKEFDEAEETVSNRKGGVVKAQDGNSGFERPTKIIWSGNKWAPHWAAMDTVERPIYVWSEEPIPDNLMPQNMYDAVIAERKNKVTDQKETTPSESNDNARDVYIIDSSKKNKNLNASNVNRKLNDQIITVRNLNNDRGLIYKPFNLVGYSKSGGVVKGQNSIPGGIPAEPPTGYNGEIRQYIDRRNPIRRRIDTFVENNPYAKKIVSLGKGIKESPLGMLFPDFSNGIAGAVAPAGKISKLTDNQKADFLGYRIPTQGPGTSTKIEFMPRYNVIKPTDADADIDNILNSVNNYQYIKPYVPEGPMINFDFSGLNDYIKNTAFTKPSIGQRLINNPLAWSIGIGGAGAGAAILLNERDKRKKKQGNKSETKQQNK